MTGLWYFRGVFCSPTSALPAWWWPRSGRWSLPFAEETEGEGCSAASRESSLLEDFIYIFFFSFLLAKNRKQVYLMKRPVALCFRFSPFRVQCVDRAQKKLLWVIDVGGQQVNECSPSTQISLLAFKKNKILGKLHASALFVPAWGAQAAPKIGSLGFYRCEDQL